MLASRAGPTRGLRAPTLRPLAQSKYRARFFRLMDIFLASPMVPAYTAAAFAKRFARLALGAPPSGALLCIAFIHNIVRRHPACMQLLHRAPKAAAAAASGGEGGAAQQQQQGGAQHVDGSAAQQQQGRSVHEGQDPFDAAEPDPASSHALESSLWEVEALRVHHNPSVSGSASQGGAQGAAPLTRCPPSRADG